MAERKYVMVSAKLLKQQFLSLTVNIFGEYASTIFLGIYRFFIKANPWLLALNPPLKDLNGNIYTSLLSRVNSGLHIGSIKPSIRDRVILSNIFIVLLTLIITSLIIIFAVKLLVGGDLLLIFEAVIPSMILVSIILYPLTTYSSIQLYMRGLDPESFMLPIIFVLADVLTTPILIIYTMTLYSTRVLIRHIIFILTLIFIILIAYLSYGLRIRGTMRAFSESQLILLLCLLLDVGAGSYLAQNIELLVNYPFTILTVPIFNSLSGSLASIYAVRQNILYHMGITSLKPNLEKLSYLPYMYFLSIYSSVILGLTGYGLTYIITHTLISSIIIDLLIPLIASIIIVPILWVLIQIFSYISFKTGFDPDNVMAPILTSMIDLIGSIVYVLSAYMILSIT
jgi:mgtE-like transporter